MKKVSLFNSISEFEKFINRIDIEVLQVFDVKVVEQSFFFQENFAAIIFYKEFNNLINETKT